MVTILTRMGNQYSRVEIGSEAKGHSYPSWEHLRQYLLKLEVFGNFPEWIGALDKVKAELDSKGSCDLDAVLLLTSHAFGSAS